MTALCNKSKCRRPAEKRGMCGRCYQRWRKQTPKSLRSTPTPLERFWAKVEKTDRVPSHAPHLGPCWEWAGAKRPSGHGEFSHSQEHGNVPAHAFALEIATGQAGPPGQESCHHCDNPSCVRPTHLYFGTRQENVDDAWHRERHPVGSERSPARLTEVDVEEIRTRYAAGASGAALALEYGIRPSSIYSITSGRKWLNAGGPITRRSAS